MIKFFRVRTPGQTPGTVVVVAEDTEASFLLRYVPNTGLWHRANELSNDYLFGDEGGTYEPISADEAAGLIGKVAPFDERRDVAQRLLARFQTQPAAEQRTNAEMGLSQPQKARNVMRDLVTEAKEVATAAHQGQFDKTGSPYIGHPGRVAGYVTEHAAGEDLETARAVAWLHDVVEDTPVTLADLAQQFPADVVAAVDAMTKRAGEESEAYYRRVRANRIARAVKNADLDDNTDPARTAQLDPATRQRLAAKYTHARSVLSGN